MNLRESIITRINKEFNEAQTVVHVEGNHVILQITSDCFEGKSQVQRQQMVYACVNDLIQSGELHAITIQATTANE